MTYQLTTQEESDIKDVITIYGNQTDESVSTNLLGPALRAMKLNPLEREVMDFIADFDRNGSGIIQKEDFVKIYYRKKKDSDTIEELLAALKLLDREGNGQMLTTEFRYFMCRMGEMLPEEDVDDIVKQADNEGNGRVNILKFAKYLLGIKEEK